MIEFDQFRSSIINKKKFGTVFKWLTHWRINIIFETSERQYRFFNFLSLWDHVNLFNRLLIIRFDIIKRHLIYSTLIFFKREIFIVNNLIFVEHSDKAINTWFFIIQFHRSFFYFLNLIQHNQLVMFRQYYFCNYDYKII